MAAVSSLQWNTMDKPGYSSSQWIKHRDEEVDWEKKPVWEREDVSPAAKGSKYGWVADSKKGNLTYTLSGEVDKKKKRSEAILHIGENSKKMKKTKKMEKMGKMKKKKREKQRDIQTYCHWRRRNDRWIKEDESTQGPKNQPCYRGCGSKWVFLIFALFASHRIKREVWQNTCAAPSLTQLMQKLSSVMLCSPTYH